MNIFSQTINGMQEVLGICPCCGEIFRLVESRFVFPEKASKACEYTQLVSLEGRNSREDERLVRAEERFERKLAEQKENLRKAGRKRAKQRLRKIDPVFSARNIDPQDVKVVFDPVEYIIFHGFKSDDGIDFIEFVSREPESRQQEKTLKSIERAIKTGDVEFETLCMRDDGSFVVNRE